MSTEIHVLNATARTETGKGVARKLRAAGSLPGVCYGYQLEEPQAVTLEPRELLDGLRSPFGRNTVFELKLAGREHHVVLKDHQEAVISNKLLHVDLLAIDLTKPVYVNVPLRFTGKSPGVVLDAGIIEYRRHQVEVECLPTAIPLAIDVDLSEVRVGDVLHIGDIVMPAKVRAITPAHLTVLTCTAPIVVEEAAAETEEASEAAAAGEADSEAGGAE